MHYWLKGGSASLSVLRAVIRQVSPFSEFVCLAICDCDESWDLLSLNSATSHNISKKNVVSLDNFSGIFEVDW